MVTDEKCKNYIYIFFQYLFWTRNLAKLTCQFYMNFLLGLLHTHFICKYWRSCFFPTPIYLLSLFIGLAKTFIIVLTRIVESRFLCLFSHLKRKAFNTLLLSWCVLLDFWRCPLSGYGFFFNINGCWIFWAVFLHQLSKLFPP